MTAICAAAENPAVDVEKMERLLAMQEKISADQARRAYVEALHGFQAECPQIHRSGGIEVQGRTRSKYSPYEDMMKTVRPYMQKYGFSESFDTQTNQQDVISAVTCTLSHIMGHSERSTFPVMPDRSGSKNDIQAIGSALSYGKRYSIGAALGLVFTDEDDDARAASAASERADDLEGGAAVGKKAADDEQRKKFVAAINKVRTSSGVSDCDLTAAMQELVPAHNGAWFELDLKSLKGLSTTKGWSKAMTTIENNKKGQEQ